MTEEMRQRLWEFLGASVTENTRKGYERHWEEWRAFVREVAGSDDPYLRGCRPTERAPLLAVFLQERHGSGLRNRGATAVSAGIRLQFVRALEPSEFFDEPVLTAARAACKATSAELRVIKNQGPSESVKLPLCQSLVASRRELNWTQRSWDFPDIDRRALYLATIWAFDMGARVSEYTAAEKGGEDHCIRAGDLLFDFETGVTQFLVRGGEEYFARVRSGIEEKGNVVGCWVRGSTHKSGEMAKTKLIGRRTPDEVQLLEDLVEWVTRSGVAPEDELFGRYAAVRGKQSFKRLWPREIRGEVKAICLEAGLDPKYFSAHSLRKGAQTHMSALGVSLDDRRDRGNYSATSEMPRRTYDYSSAGHGALSASALAVGVAPSVRDIKRYLPHEAGHLGEVGGGGPR